jgi:GAF domain-containing protein
VDGTTIVGATAFFGELRLIVDTMSDFTFSNKISDSKTKAELSLPLRLREQTIGVLYLQSEHKEVFTGENIDALTIVADQVAVGINYARLYSETKSALAESREIIEYYVRQEWNSFTKRSKQNGFVFDGRQVMPLNGQFRSDRSKVISQTGSLTLDKTSANVIVPIKLRGLTIGILEVRPKKGKREWTDDELTLLEAAADRAAFALENARLVESAQRRASRERAIGEISNKIGAISDRNIILQTAVEELGRRIGNTEIVIEIETDSEFGDGKKA